jgi:hypothetical protein
LAPLELVEDEVADSAAMASLSRCAPSGEERGTISILITPLDSFIQGLHGKMGFTQSNCLHHFEMNQDM